MSSETIRMLFLIGYCLFFTLCNLFVFLFYYFFGYFFEKKLRKFDMRVMLPAKLLFLFRFKGIYGEDRLNASRGGAISQFGAYIYFFFMETLCFALCRILSDTIFACRLAFALFAILIVSGIVRVFVTNHVIHKNVKEKTRLEVKNFVEESAVNKENADIDQSIKNMDAPEKERMLEMELDMLWQEENERENETTNAEEGKTAMKTKNIDIIGTDFEAGTEDDFEEKGEEATSLSEIKTSEKGVYIVERDLKKEFAADYDDFIAPDDAAEELLPDNDYVKSLNDMMISERERNFDVEPDMIWQTENGFENEAADADFGKRALRKRKSDIIGDEFDLEFDSVTSYEDDGVASLSEIRKSKMPARDYKKDLSADFEEFSDSKGEADNYSLGKEYLKKMKKDIIGDDYDPMFDDSDAFNQ